MYILNSTLLFYQHEDDSLLFLILLVAVGEYIMSLSQSIHNTYRWSRTDWKRVCKFTWI